MTASPQEFALAQSANSDFAVDLYRQLAKERPGENLFFSPFSISSALLIATEGASGETADQMGKVLHVPKALAHKGPDAASLPWQLTALHKGQAAIYYRLSPEPISPELRDKIARLRATSTRPIAGLPLWIIPPSGKRPGSPRPPPRSSPTN